jgi:hypothetical protein
MKRRRVGNMKKREKKRRRRVGTAVERFGCLIYIDQVAESVIQ